MRIHLTFTDLKNWQYQFWCQIALLISSIQMTLLLECQIEMLMPQFDIGMRVWQTASPFLRNDYFITIP